MRWSLTASLGLHVAILIAALVVLPSPHMDIAPQQAIQVDITNIGDISKLMATSKDGETPKEKPASKKTDTVVKTDPAEKADKKIVKAVKEAAATPPPAPEPKPEPPKPEPPKPDPPKPDPKPPEPMPLDPAALQGLIKDTVTDTPAPKKEPPKKPETKPAEAKPATPPKKAEKKQAKLNPDEIAAFLNKADASSAPAQPSTANGKQAKGEKTLQGTDQQMSATIGAAFLQKVQGCWTVPPGALEANIVVQLHFYMKPDGGIAGTPEVTNANGDSLFEATARSAVSAVLDCQPYDFLPKDRYDLWKDNTMAFNPNMMTN